jgi:hypothetical protein
MEEAIHFTYFFVFCLSLCVCFFLVLCGGVLVVVVEREGGRGEEGKERVELGFGFWD